MYDQSTEINISNLQVIFAALVAYSSAGLIPLDDGIGLGGLGSIGLGGIALAPKVISAPIAVKVRVRRTN